MKYKHLVCFFSYKRPELTERSFLNLLENIRPTDRLLVIDQERYNTDFYLKYRDRIDFLMTNKVNYEIGPAWMLIRNLVNWLKEKNSSFKDKEVKAWCPEVIDIVESDTIGNQGWIDRVEILLDLPRVGIASGFYEKGIRRLLKPADENGIMYAETANGVNMMFKIDYFLDLFSILGGKGQDWAVSQLNLKNGKIVALRDEIEHIGEQSRRGTY
jgi:hypothetical protein